MMKKLVLAIGLFLVIGVVLADEPAKFNFGTMQPTGQFSAEPGTTVEQKLYFYNIYGNRVTHVRLIVEEAPQGWEIGFEPEVGVATFEVSGQEVDSLENIFVEPSETLAERPSVIPDGVEFLEAGGIDGWIPAKVVKVRFRIPEDTPLGNQRVRIDATAHWFGTQGVVVSQQARSFDYRVSVALGEYSEQMIARNNLIRQMAGFVSPFLAYLPYISVALVVLMAAGLYVLNQKVEEAREMTEVLKTMDRKKKGKRKR